MENDDNQIDVYLPKKQSMQQNSHTWSRLWATKLVLSYPVWKGQLQAGTEMSFVKRQSSTSITNYPLPSTDADVKENNVAAFVVYNANLEKYGSVSAGLRYEHVGFDYMDNLDAENNITRYQDEFFQRPYLLSELVYPGAGRLETKECNHAGGEYQCPLEVDQPVCCLRTSRQHHHTGANGL